MNLCEGNWDDQKTSVFSVSEFSPCVFLPICKYAKQTLWFIECAFCALLTNLELVTHSARKYGLLALRMRKKNIDKSKTHPPRKRDTHITTKSHVPPALRCVLLIYWSSLRGMSSSQHFVGVFRWWRLGCFESIVFSQRIESTHTNTRITSHVLCAFAFRISLPVVGCWPVIDGGGGHWLVNFVNAGARTMWLRQRQLF